MGRLCYLKRAAWKPSRRHAIDDTLEARDFSFNVVSIATLTAHLASAALPNDLYLSSTIFGLSPHVNVKSGAQEFPESRIQADTCRCNIFSERTSNCKRSPRSCLSRQRVFHQINVRQMNQADWYSTSSSSAVCFVRKTRQSDEKSDGRYRLVPRARARARSW